METKNLDVEKIRQNQKHLPFRKKVFTEYSDKELKELVIDHYVDCGKRLTMSAFLKKQGVSQDSKMLNCAKRYRGVIKNCVI